MSFTLVFTLLTFLIYQNVTAAVVAPRMLAPYHPRTRPSEVEDYYLVRLEQHHTLEAHFERIGMNISAEAPKGSFGWIHHIQAYHAKLDYSQVHDYIRKDPEVKYVRHQTIATPAFSITNGSFSMEEDTQSGLSRRWKMTSSDTKLPYYVPMSTKKYSEVVPRTDFAVDGAGHDVDIYIMDSGVRITHDYFKDGKVQHFKDQDPSDYIDGEPATDLVGHGTRVAGIAKQMAPWATIISVKIGSKGPILDGPCIRAFNDILNVHLDKRDNPPEKWRGSVINMSVFIDPSEDLATMVQAVHDGGIPVTIASGNEGKEASEAPCIYNDAVICVGGCDREYTWDQLSDYGSKVAIIAPGVDIVSSSFTGDDHVSTKSGTSYAAPIVAGIMAHYVSYERLYKDITTLKKRLMDNALSDLITNLPRNTANKIAQTGIHNPTKKDNVPYQGAPSQEVGNEVQDQGEAPVEHVTAALPVPATLTATSTPTGLSNVWEGSIQNKFPSEDDGLNPFCTPGPITPLLNATALFTLFTLSPFDQASTGQMPENCKRKDNTPCDPTDNSGCWNIPGGPIVGHSFKICGPWGVTLPKATAGAAMVAINTNCNRDGYVSGVIEFPGEIRIRLY